MVQPKYNPQEALERVKLMMKYDMSKTLNENKSIIFEQVNCPNAISDDEMEEICNEMWDNLQGLQMIFVRMFKDKKDNAKNIFNSINDLIGKNHKDDLTGQCEPAIKSFKKFYKERAKEGGWFGFSTDGSIENELKNIKNDKYFNSSGDKVTKYIDAAIKILQTEKSHNVPEQPTPQPTVLGWEKFPCVPTLANQKGVTMSSNGSFVIGNFRYFANGRKGDITTKQILNYTCNDPEFVGKKGGRKTGSKYKTCSEQLPIKFGCKNETIKYIQGPECLGITADGKFGPKTKQALIDKGENGNQIDSGTMIAVCKKPTSTIQPDEITLVDAEDSTKLRE